MDAMNPNTLRRRVEEAILKYIEPEAWARVEVGEKAVVESLQAVMDGWASIQGRDRG